MVFHMMHAHTYIIIMQNHNECKHIYNVTHENIEEPGDMPACVYIAMHV